MRPKSYSEQMEEQLEPRPERAPSAHETYVRSHLPEDWPYDPADDGPEVEIIRKATRCA